jgi:NADPH2:quinone reductase
MTCEALIGPRGLAPHRYARASLAPHEVRVALHAAGVNFVDVLITRGLYQYRPTPPFVPGLEGVGHVIETGSGVHGLAVDDRVLASAHTGMYATEVVVPADALWPAPAGFNDPEAACFRVAALTARHALLDRGGLRDGETVLVLGAGGGLGLAAVELAALLGARVIAVASSIDKRNAAAARGAQYVIDSNVESLVANVRALAPDGVDLVFDPVGGAAFETALRLLGWGGRLLVTGFASGTIGRIAANLPLLKGASVLGVRAGEAMRRDAALERRNRQELLEWAAQGRLRPWISDVWPLAEAAQALAALEQRSVVGRLALSISP